METFYVCRHHTGEFLGIEERLVGYSFLDRSVCRWASKRASTGRGGAPWVTVTEDLPEVGCPGCGCPEFHDGEYQLCPAYKEA